MKEKILIEFIGLPGSGKTTIATLLCKKDKRFIDILPKRNSFKINFFETVYRHFISLIFISLNPLYSYKVFKIIWSTKQNSLNNFRAVSINFFYKSYLYSKSKKNEISVLDEGVLHAVLSIMISSKRSDKLFSHLDILLRTYNHKKILLFYIEVNDDEVINRLKFRSNDGKRHRVLKSSSICDLKLVKHSFNNLVELCILKFENIDVIKIQNDSSIASADELYNQLNLMCFI